MKKYLFLLYFLSSNILAGSGSSIYSEYYPNSTAAFKGTIIFENGSGTTIDEWKSNKIFFNCVKQNGSVLIYDRSGLGKSPPDLQLSATHPITAKLVSDGLAALLVTRDIKPPYILVAHSYGAIYAGYFVLTHPRQIKALILVDPVGRDFQFSTQVRQKYKKGIQEAKIRPANCIYNKYGAKAEVIYQLLGFEESKKSIKALGEIDDGIPVVIISSQAMEKERPLKQDWYQNQKQWLNKNPHSTIIQVTASHFIQLDQPQFVCDVIKKLSH